MHKHLDDLSLWDAHIKYRISFMSVYSELYCAKFDICSFIVNSFILDGKRYIAIEQKILRRTGQNAIIEGDLECILTRLL